MQADPPARSWSRFADPAALERLGATVAGRLAAGEAICLFGPLGAGKTTLARGLIRALTDPGQETPSPTFTLMQTYDGPGFPIAHFDLYRLKGPQEAFEIGLDEALDAGAVVVEWSERLEDSLPPDRLEVRLAVHPPGEGGGTVADGRWASWRGFGTWREKAFDP